VPGSTDGYKTDGAPLRRPVGFVWERLFSQDAVATPTLIGPGVGQDLCLRSANTAA
jgi:hypothetical protein